MPRAPGSEEHFPTAGSYRALLGPVVPLQAAASWAGDEAMVAARPLHLLVEQRLQLVKPPTQS